MNELAAQQNALLAAIFSETTKMFSDELGEGIDREGLEIYRANLRATSLQALKVTFPTIEALIGEPLMAHAAEKLLAKAPPYHGDWARWGEAFAEVLEGIDALEAFPFISDCARLDYICHQMVRDVDALTDRASLALLESEDPDRMGVELNPSLVLIESRFPIERIRSAHRLQGDERQKALADAVETLNDRYFIACFRDGYEVAVRSVSEMEYNWLLLLKEHTLGEALSEIDLDKFSFEQWLLESVNNNLIHKFLMI